jgi:hypothetical protein
MRAILRSVLFVSSVAFVGPLASSARADEADEMRINRASVLFEEGRRLSGEGRHGEACALFEQSLELVEGVGTQFNLADCWERVGRTASAQALFAKAAMGANRAGQLDREKLALERSAALEPRLSRMVIEVTGSPESVVVRRNRERVEFETWGKPVPVDPGAYDIEVTEQGKAPWLKSVKVPPGAAVVLVTVPALEAAEATAQPPAADPVADQATAPEVPASTAGVDSDAVSDPAPLPEPPAPRSATPHAATVGLLALGVGGVAAGTLFALKYDSRSEDAEAVCHSRDAACTADDLKRYDQLASDARASRTGAIVSFSVGGVALAGAAFTHWVFGLRPAVSNSGLYPQPVVSSDGSWGLVSRGRF